jgi:prevent-host-death family protein
MKTVTASEANRSFSKLLGEVRKGATIDITSHGAIVARIVPAASVDEAERRRTMEDAREALFERLRTQPPSDIRWRFNRDELYDDEG